MSEEFHAILVDKSLGDESILERLNVIGKEEGSWTLIKIAVDESDLEKIIKDIQANMREGSWYFHFYNADGSKLLIVYKDKSFATDNNPENWKVAIDYGTSLNIPLEQLDFVPNRFSEEKF